MNDHIIMTPEGAECTHCGTTMQLKMPMAVEGMLTQMDVFSDAHERCKAPAIETVMSEYISGFDAGCNFVMKEIEKFQRKHGHSAMLDELVTHLKQEKLNER